MPDLRLVPKTELERLLAADVDPDARLALLADACRLNAHVAVKRAGTGHLGSTFSALDIVAQLLFDELDVAECEEGCVQARHVVTLRREEDVAVGIVESALGDVQLVEEELGDDVERTERRAEVTGAGTLHRDERVQSARVGQERQPRVGVDVGCQQTLELGLRDKAQVRHRLETVADPLTVPQARHRAVSLRGSKGRRAPSGAPCRLRSERGTRRRAGG